MWVLLLGCRPPVPPVAAPPISASREAMGTAVVLTASGAPHAVVDPAFEEVFAEFERIEALCSEWRPGTPLAEVNARAGAGAVEVPHELAELLRTALSFSARTEGAFDPTFAAMWGLWTFGDDGIRSLPDPAEVERRRPLVDWRKVRLEGDTVHLPEAGMKLGLGGIAKGYATDRAVAILRAHRLVDFAVQAGGELYVAGHAGDRPWWVGVRDPRGEGPFARLALSDAAFDTSGDYERYFDQDGVRYHHVVDPATGWPARASRSATVLAPDATTADALSTALFVLGPDRGRAVLAREFPGIEAVWVDGEGRVVVTDGLAGRLEILRPPTASPM